MSNNGQMNRLTIWADADSYSGTVIIKVTDEMGYTFSIFHINDSMEVARVESVDPLLGFKLDGLGRVATPDQKTIDRDASR